MGRRTLLLRDGSRRGNAYAVSTHDDQRIGEFAGHRTSRVFPLAFTRVWRITDARRTAKTCDVGVDVWIYAALWDDGSLTVLTICSAEDHRKGAAGTAGFVDRLRSAGAPAVGVETEVRREDGVTLCDPGEPGEIYARGPNIMLGYLNRPEETAKALINGWYRTGDVAYSDKHGYLYIVDRAKDMIISGGENIYTTEVENALYAHPAVLECAVLGVPHESWGEAVHAEVVPKLGSAVTGEELIAHCRTLIGGYKVPRSINVRTEPLPKSGAGKILKRDLREPFWAGKDRSVN
jgi:long-chain acyl-CoA synthetase